MDEHREAPRRERATTGEPASQAQFLVRIFCLADYATATPDGKLYIAGAGVDRVLIVNPQAPMPTLYLVGRIAVPYAMTSEPHQVTIRLLTADRNPVLESSVPDPLLAFAGETGRPPGARPEDDLCIQFALGLNGLPPLPAGIMFFHLGVDDQPVAALPLRILRLSRPE